MKINLLSKINVKNNVNANYGFHNNFMYPNLAPLNKDTVSFSGRSELIAENMVDAPQAKLCTEIEKNAVGACYYLYTVLDKYIGDIAEFEENDTTRNALMVKANPCLKDKKNKVATYELRIKSRSSIREKVVSKFGKLHKSECEQYSNDLLNILEQHFPIRKGVEREDVLTSMTRSIQQASDAKGPIFDEHIGQNINNTVSHLKYMNYLDFGDADSEKIDRVIASATRELELRESRLMSDGKFMDPKSKVGIKHYANDVVGARIVMQDGNQESTDKIIQALKKAVDDGVLKITSIENNIPAFDRIPQGKSQDDYSYASSKTLNTLKNAAQVELITNESKTGYMAIHINVDLNNSLFKNYGGVFNGYSGEIQIIGRDVAQLKEVEDLCYKFKDKKNAVNVAFKPFKDYFLKFYKDNAVQAFDDYTYALYLEQRMKGKKRRSNVFPTIKELGFEGKVPPQLDFNKLKPIYQGCKNISEAQELDLKTKKTERDIINEGNFKTIKRLIENKIYSD